jgi:hypothetical protein
VWRGVGFFFGDDIIVWLPFMEHRGAVGEIERRGDRDSIIVETSCCRVPTIVGSDQAVGISHHDGGCGSRSPPYHFFPPRVVVSQNLPGTVAAKFDMSTEPKTSARTDTHVGQW